MAAAARFRGVYPAGARLQGPNGACGWIGRFGLDIAGADETIQAVNVDATDAPTLEVPAGAAVLRVLATGHLAGDVPLWYERTLCRGDAYAFRHRAGRAVRPPVGTLVDVPDEETLMP
jgi:hypothetical protein